MSFRIIQLENLEVNIKYEKDYLSLCFTGAHIKKTMDDAYEKTLWSQNGSIEIKNILDDNIILNDKDIISSINISFDSYTYKNMLVLPFSKRGDIILEIEFKNLEENINIRCSEMEILLIGDPEYMRHIKKME